MAPTRLLVLVTLALSVRLSGIPVDARLRADEPSPFRSLGELNDAYARKLLELDRKRVADLDALASRGKGADADAAYSQMFRIAVSRGLSADAEAAASRCLSATTSGAEVRRLAHLVRVLARAEKGDHVQALERVKALVKAPAGTERTDPETVMAVGEAFLQRLLSEGRYDDARELCECACDAEDAPAAVKDHFEARMGRIGLLGKPAPAIGGSDVDGKPVSLAGLKGKVVLVDFWATWCPPCVAAVPGLNALAEKYRDRGFEVLGVNVDALHEDVKDAKTALPVVRRFLVEHGVSWTCLLNGAGAGDVTKVYGVSEIPANFLIDRDGKVIALELNGDGLANAVSRALGPDAASRPK